MPAAARVSLEEYLRSQYEPERELIAGELIPKPSGTLEHMDMERRLIRLLSVYEERGLGRAVHELSFRRGEEIRIPDLVFVSSDARFERGVLMDPPLLCVEILSPFQRPSELFAKCEMYHAWMVPSCWVIDPVKRISWDYPAGGPVQLVAESGWLRAGEIAVSMDDLFR